LIRPDAIPVSVVGSRAVLAAEQVAVLFGKGHRLRGTERVQLMRAGEALCTLAVETGPAFRLVLDALDCDASGTEASLLRLKGPAGASPAPPVEKTATVLAVPTVLQGPWGLRAGHSVAIQLGKLVLLGVPVEAGQSARLSVDRATMLAAGADVKTTVRLLRDLAIPALEAATATSPTGPLRVERRLITENDVRQARLKHRKISVAPGQIVTPAALSLGRELGVFEK
jgi:hypothetical protein